MSPTKLLEKYATKFSVHLTVSEIIKIIKKVKVLELRSALHTTRFKIKKFYMVLALR